MEVTLKLTLFPEIFRSKLMAHEKDKDGHVINRTMMALQHHLIRTKVFQCCRFFW